MLRNCCECNRVFAHPTSKECPQCHKKRQVDFTMVKQYLQTNMGATIQMVVEETGVSYERVDEFIKEGRLNVLPTDAVRRCGVCQAPIQNGRVCGKCRSQLKPVEPTVLQEQAVKPRSSGKIHSLETIRKRDSDN